MAVTQADIDALNDAIKSGERQVVIGGESVTYNTTESLIKARDDQQTLLNRQLARDASNVRRRPQQTVVVYQGRGYNG